MPLAPRKTDNLLLLHLSFSSCICVISFFLDALYTLERLCAGCALSFSLSLSLSPMGGGGRCRVCWGRTFAFASRFALSGGLCVRAGPGARRDAWWSCACRGPPFACRSCSSQPESGRVCERLSVAGGAGAAAAHFSFLSLPRPFVVGSAARTKNNRRDRRRARRGRGGTTEARARRGRARGKGARTPPLSRQVTPRP
jgi:hypothetical protein